MKKLIFLLFFIPLQQLSAQMITGFSADKTKFIKEFETYLGVVKREDVDKALNEFAMHFSSGKMTDPVIQSVISCGNTMAVRQMPAYPYYYQYALTVNALIRSGRSETLVISFLKGLGELIRNQKKGSNAEFVRYLDFAVVFFEKGLLEESPGKKYWVGAQEFIIQSDKGMPVYVFQQTDLFGHVPGDSFVIRETSGKYAPVSKKWEGKTGKVDWSRCGLDPTKVRATFGQYSIDFLGYGYSVDSVTFHHPEYFDKPLTGRLTDKLVPNIDSNRISYPRFESYDRQLAIRDFAPDVTFHGGFSLWGNRVIGYGTTDQKARLDFYDKKTKRKILTVISESISFKKGEELGATDAAISVYFGDDSVYHPRLNMLYKIQQRELKMLRGNSGQSKAQFYDSYHQFAFETDAIFWNLDSSLLNLKILSGIGQTPAVFESKDYFSKETMRKVQGMASYEPLFILQKLVKENNDDPDLDATRVAKALNPSLTEGESRSLFYELVEKGFIEYKEDIGRVIVREKTGMYVRANAKKIDYDIIRIKSTPRSGVENIDMQKNTIDLKGVFRVPISDTANVAFIPKNNNLTLEKDRNMKFDGLLIGGRMDIFGRDHHFNYAPFTVDVPQVDSMRINIPDGNKTDAEGNPILVTLRSKIENLKGYLEIDAPINKSGRARLLQFPKLVNRENSFIFYDESNIAGGAYKRDQFFFQIYPFKLDSLNSFSPDVINWRGKMVSGIMPEFEENLKIQEDLSLGFSTESPSEGWALYKDKGTFTGGIKIDYRGMTAKGAITHSTASFDADTMQFFPDSTLAVAKQFSIARVEDGVKTPSVVSSGNPIRWLTKADSMFIRQKGDPFQMYDGRTQLTGGLLLSANGLSGNGTIDWAEANLTSRQFRFQTEELTGDSARLNIKGAEAGKVAFTSPNVQAKIDFKARLGDFKSNQPDVPTVFDFNKYNTAINQFQWFIDEKILEFNAPISAVNGAPFTSLKADQKGLTFNGKKGIYDLETSIMEVQGVNDIRVADASVTPDSGIVIIEGDARMRDLSNAVITADTLNKTHRIDKASVSILSKERLIASGDYQYKSEGLPDQMIRFNDITCVSEVKGDKKKATTEWHLSAKGEIDAFKKFLIYQRLNFRGTANLYSQRPGLIFDGFARIDFTRSSLRHQEFNIRQEVDPQKLNLAFGDTTVNGEGIKLASGIWIQKSDVPYLYTALLGPKTDQTDSPLLALTGSVMHDPKSGDWMFGDVQKGYESAPTGNIIRYNDESGKVKGEGLLRLGQFGPLSVMAAGQIEAFPDSQRYELNATVALDFSTLKDIDERVKNFLFTDNQDNTDLNYDREPFRRQLAELSGDQSGQVMEAFEKELQFKRPKSLTPFLILSDVNLVFDPADGSLRSKGKLGLSWVGDKAVHKKVNGYLEIAYKSGGDMINLYLQNANDAWFFFEYRPGFLGIFNSMEYDEVTRLLTALPAAKRIRKFPDGKTITCGMGSSMNQEDFVYRMREKSGLKNDMPLPRPRKVIDTVSINQDSTIVNPVPAAVEQTDSRKAPRVRGRRGGPPPPPITAPADSVMNETTMPSEEVAPPRPQTERERMEKQLYRGGGMREGGLFDAPPGREEPVKETPPSQQQETEQEQPQAAPPVQEEPVQPEPVNEEPQSQPEPVQEQPQAAPPVQQEPGTSSSDQSVGTQPK